MPSRGHHRPEDQSATPEGTAPAEEPEATPAPEELESKLSSDELPAQEEPLAQVVSEPEVEPEVESAPENDPPEDDVESGAEEVPEAEAEDIVVLPPTAVGPDGRTHITKQLYTQ